MFDMLSRKKIIGEGNFGCTLKPNYACPSFNSNANYVSKLVPVDNDEYNELLASKIKTINGYENYYIIQEASCVFAPSRISNTYKKCGICTKTNICDTPSNLKNNILRYGGQNLKSFGRGSFNGEVIFSILINLTRGLQLLHEINVAHRDIKPENIVIDDHFVARYIDWGVSVCDTGCSNNDVQQAITYGSIFYSSPETFITREVMADVNEFGKVYQNLDFYDKKEWVNNVFANMRQSYVELPVMDVYGEMKTPDLREYGITENLRETYIDIWKENDIFMLGMTFMYILYYHADDLLIGMLMRILHSMVIAKHRRSTLTEITEQLMFAHNEYKHQHKYLKYKSKYNLLKQQTNNKHL